MQLSGTMIFIFFNKSYWQTRKLCKGNDKIPGRVVVLKKYFFNSIASIVRYLYGNKQGEGS